MALGKRATSSRPGRGEIRWGVRKRSTAVAVGVVAVALLLGGVVLLFLLQASLTRSSDAAARQKAQDVVAEMDDMDVADARAYIVDTAHAGQFVQVLDTEGYVLAASDTEVANAPLSAQRPSPGQTMTQDVSSLPSIGDNDDYHIVTVGARTGSVNYTVVVAQASQIQADTISTVAWFMLGATPLLLVTVAGSVWLLVGRSLRQVERIRGQVARINAERLDGRVDVPPTNDELQALALTMNTMLDRLQASDTEQRRFVSDASHELRSPLATLRAGIEIAAGDPTGAMWLQMKDVLAEETTRMSFLVEDLLTLAKANDGGLRVEQKDVDLDDVLDQEIRRLRSTSRNQISVKLVPARIRGDARRLTQVLRNVLDNADRHALSRIAVDLHTAGDRVIITVDNDGDPIPEADRERVFERFVRLDGSRSREGGGSGLGLAIAAGIVAAHHGSIRPTDGPAGHCRFEIAFPRQETVEPADVTPRESRRHGVQGSGRR
ncbi:cell wall metabolism sensor histidine kinase WalK [Arthrobacter sp. ok362]|uniref:sensor histidine kinase n=1 Tax=Arthrobacter sp. ok362 TaxID=1761745 RepID=UPI00088D5D12|nr:ATP-binding protein [Arthrobacter sp. ok362]SDL23347.1 Signal transduction histidine kinase [Arthrobacter sp. ok362]